MDTNKLDFLQYLQDDGSMDLDKINSFLGAEEQEDPNNPDFKKDEDPENPGENPLLKERALEIDGLEYLNNPKKFEKGSEESSEENLEDPLKQAENASEEPEEPEEAGESEIPYFEIFGKGLVEKGLLQLEENEDPDKLQWTEETFLEKFQSTVENSAWLKLEEIATETFGEEGIKLVEDLFINQVPVREYLASFQQEKSFDSLDLSSERNQAEVVKYYLQMTTGDSEEEIAEQIEYFKERDILEKKAADYQQKLVTNEKKIREKMVAENQAKQEQQRQLEQQRIKTYSDLVNKAAKEGDLDGLPFKKEDVNKVLSSVLDKKHVLPSGQKITDFELKLAKMRVEDPVKFLKVAKLVEDDLDLTPIKTKGVTEKTDTIFGKLQNKTKVSSSVNKKKGSAFQTYLKNI